MGSPTLEGLRVLVVEDELLISLMIEDMLIDAGCQVVGPCDRLPAALDVARYQAIDLAVLDVNIAGEMIYPVAEILDARGIPFVIVSGYGRAAIPGDRTDWLVCSKPFRVDELVAMLLIQSVRATHTK